MKRLFTILSAAALVLMAGSCIKEQLTVFNQTDADAPVLADSFTLMPNNQDPKSVVLSYTPAVFHQSFNPKMVASYSVALVSVDGKSVDKTVGASFDEENHTITVSLSALSKVLMGMGYAEGSRPTVGLAVRASIQPTIYDPSVLSYVQSDKTVSVSGFAVTAPAGSPYTEYTSASPWSVIGSLDNYGVSWNGDLEMWMTEDQTRHVAKAVYLKEGDEFKFRKEQGWTDNFGGTFGALDAPFEAVAGGNNIKIGASGVYDLWLDTEAKTITVTEAYLPYPGYKSASDWSVIGSLSAYGMSWDGDLKMFTDGNKELALNITIKNGDEFKFRKDKSWTDNFGGTFGALDADFDAVAGGDNIKLEAGAYDMLLDTDAKTIRIVESTGAGISTLIVSEEEGGDEPEEEIIDEAWAVIGNVDGTSWDKDFYMTESDGIWTSPALSFEAGAEFKLRFDNTWFYEDCIFGAAEENVFVPVGTAVTGTQPGSNFKVQDAGDYYITFDESKSELTLHSLVNCYSLIGNINGSSWNKDFYLFESDGVWTSNEVSIAGEFKIRFNKSWADKDCYGTDSKTGTPVNTAFTATQPGFNFQVEEGKYTVVFVPATKSVTIIPAKPSNTWSVIGVNGDWGNDFFMNEVAPGIWISETLDITSAGWKLRFNHDWEVNRGGANGDELTAPGQFTEGVANGKDFQLTGKFKVVYNAISDAVGTLGWGVVGKIASIEGFDWNNDIPMNLASDGKWYSVPVALGTDDEIKIRWMGGWDKNFGGESKDAIAADTAVKVKDGGDNFKAATAGTYMVVYDPTAGTLTLSTDFYGLIGGFNEWDSDIFMLPGGAGKWFAYNQNITGDWKIRKGTAWDVNYGGTFTASGVAFDAQKDGTNINAGTLTDLDIELDAEALKITVTGK